MKRSQVLILCIIALCYASSASADLISYGGDLVYDTVLDITWYVPGNGNMTWSEAILWAENLTINKATDWRLPTAKNFDGSYPGYEYNISTNELGYLYYEELGNSAHGPLTNTGPFENLQPGNYWTSTTTLKYLGNAFAFNFGNGRQGQADKSKSINFYAMAIHAGNVGATSHAPVPASIFLFAPALAGLAVLRKRIRK